MNHRRMSSSIRLNIILVMNMMKTNHESLKQSEINQSKKHKNRNTMKPRKNLNRIKKRSTMTTNMKAIKRRIIKINLILNQNKIFRERRKN
jgi:hypothetical protein